MKAAPEEVRRRAEELYAAGMGCKRIARALGVAPTTVRRWVKPEYAEQLRKLAREAKQRRGGTCIDCGAPTRYAGKASGATAPRCRECGAAANGEARRVWTDDLIISRIREWVALYGEPPATPDWSPTHAAALGDWPRLDRFEQADGHWPWFVQVVRHFGTWNAGIEAAGFAPRAKGGGNGNALRKRSMRARAAA